MTAATVPVDSCPHCGRVLLIRAHGLPVTADDAAKVWDHETACDGTPPETPTPNTNPSSGSSDYADPASAARTAVLITLGGHT